MPSGRPMLVSSFRRINRYRAALHTQPRDLAGYPDLCARCAQLGGPGSSPRQFCSKCILILAPHASYLPSQNMAPTSIHAVDSGGRPQMDGLSMVECGWRASRNNIPKAVVSVMSKQVARTAEVFERAAAPMVSVAKRAHGATR